MKFIKILIATVALAAATTTVAPPAQAMMRLGNYDVLTNRYTRASWAWFVSACNPDKKPDCVDVSAMPRLKYYAYYDAYAYLVNGEYSFTANVPDGLQCPGHVMPSRDTYRWNEFTLAGTIESVYDVGCFNGPPGTQFWTFALKRL
jgi:hypothetical protein